jgi:uncharacterized alpha-E superfamily protein
MLSRVADSLYWMSRYLERAEHTARLLGVGLNQTLDQTPSSVQPRWQRLLDALHTPAPAEGLDDYAIVRKLTFDPDTPASLIACMTAARENAQQVREQISSEMWEQVNRLYLRVKYNNIDKIWQGEPQEFLQRVKKGAHLFQGITDATMSHDEGWHYIQVGRNLERAGATAHLLDLYFQPHLMAPSPEVSSLDYIDWVALLKCCTAFEAYCKVYTADVQPPLVADFLLLNEQSPRSVRFAVDRVQRGLQALAKSTNGRGAGRAERIAGRLSSNLDYAQMDEIIADDMHGYLATIRKQCDLIHQTIYQVYISYPVEAALAQ